MIILGSGMAGCIAATLNPNAVILEAAATPPDNHSAVLRFRTDAISKVTGIPFQRVKVYKSIYYEGKHHHKANPQLANLYSMKVAGKILPRSIWDLDGVERYIAPPDFHMQLLKQLESRTKYGFNVLGIDNDFIVGEGFSIVRRDLPIISTMPMPSLAEATNFDLKCEFSHSPVFTERWKVKDCNVHQTVYFPDPNSALYRATLTGSDLILEGITPDVAMINHAIEAVGLSGAVINLIKRGELRYGKISPIDDAVRKNFMFRCTHELGIYSLGRFATWKNILLDDVYDDLFMIRRMIGQSAYDLRKEF